jgi:hypothetical protein
MDRRQFLLASGATALAHAAPSPSPATVLYADRTVAIDRARMEGTELWVRASDLPKINEFELKPQGACRADVCIPVPKSMRQGEWFHLTEFARKVDQAFVAESGTWSFGEIPTLRGAFFESRVAPGFAVPDRQGRIVRLSDFKGKKVLLVTWASW